MISLPYFQKLCLQVYQCQQVKHNNQQLAYDFDKGETHASGGVFTPSEV